MPTNQSNSPLHFFRAGHGEPALLFVHGFPLDHRQWQPQLEQFQKNHLVLAPDLRGLGHSPVLPGQTTAIMEQHADDLAAFLDDQRITQPIVFIGLSMGGYIAWPFIRKYADRLQALVLCHTRVIADTPEQAQTRQDLAQQTLREHSSLAVENAMLPRLLPPHADPRLADTVRAMARTTSPAGIAANLRGMAARHDASDLMPRIHVPTLVISAELDAISTTAEMQAWAARIPGARFVSLPGVGHLSPLESPEAFNQCLAEFLRDSLGR